VTGKSVGDWSVGAVSGVRRGGGYVSRRRRIFPDRCRGGGDGCGCSLLVSHDSTLHRDGEVTLPLPGCYERRSVLRQFDARAILGCRPGDFGVISLGWGSRVRRSSLTQGGIGMVFGWWAPGWCGWGWGAVFAVEQFGTPAQISRPSLLGRVRNRRHSPGNHLRAVWCLTLWRRDIAV